MNSLAEFKKNLEQLPSKNNQENLRKLYADMAVSLYKLYLNNSLKEQELQETSTNLLSRNPDKNDKKLAEIDSFLEDLSLDPWYFAKENYTAIKEVSKEIKLGIRYAQAPGIICYYNEIKNGKTLKGYAIIIWHNGKELCVNNANNFVAHKLITLFDKQKLGLTSAAKQLPLKVSNTMLYKYSKTVITRPI